MVTFVLGRSGCGKTEYLLERLPALTAQYAQVLYLVPEQSSMALERRMGAMGLSGVKVVSFRRICNEIFRAFGGVAGRYMTRARETALIYRVLQEQQKNLVYYKTARASMGFVARLADAFAELERSGLTQQAALELFGSSKRADWQDKYRDLFLLYNAYRAALNEESRSAAEDLAAAVSLAAERGFFKDTALLIDGFFGFTGRQRELLTVAFRQSEAVYCTLLLDSADDAMMFRPIKGELAALKALAKQGGAESVEVVLKGGSKRLAHEDLRRLEAQLLSERAPEPFPAEHIRLMVGKNIREELAMVAVDIAKKVREQGYRYRDFALVAGSLSEYGAVAESVFAKYGVPLFVDQGRASLGKPIFAFVQSALRMIAPERYFRQEDVLAFLKTGLCGEAPDLIGRLENYCVVWQINGERFVREADWTQNPFGLDQPTEESNALLAELNGLRRRIRTPLLRFKERAAKGSGAALAEAVYGLLCDFNVEHHIAQTAQQYQAGSAEGANAWEAQQNRRLAREYLKLYSAMADILDDIWLVFGDAPLSIYALEELIGLCGEETALNVAPPTMDAVSIGEVAHSRPDALHLYVVGASGDLLPMPLSDSGLIGDRERRLLVQAKLPCDATMQQEGLQGRHRFYAAVFSARESITFSYSAFNMKGEPKVPSVYVERLKKLTNCSPICRMDMELYDFAVTRDGARELTGWEVSLRAPILKELGERPLTRRQTDDQLPEAIVRKLFGDKLRMSYSQIRLYQQCPFSYFMEKTMNIKPINPVIFNVENIGLFVHYGLEWLINDIKANHCDYDKYNQEQIQQYGAKLAESYLQEKLHDINQTNQFHSLYQRMTALFCMVAENVVGELREGRFRPYQTEMKLSGAPLRLENGCEVELNGSIDRVDTYESKGKTYVKVTDYKTGNTTFDTAGVTNRTGIQLPFYLYNVLRGGHFQNPVAAVGCYMNAQVPRWKAAIPPQELEQKLKLFYRRNGLITSDSQALEALDEGKGSHYFNLRYKNDGTLHADSKVYDPALIQELVAHMETIVKDTAMGIYSGNVAAIPLIDPGAERNVCSYCKYGTVCRYEAGKSPCRRISTDRDGWRKEAQA